MFRARGIKVRRLEDPDVDELADRHRRRYAGCAPDEPVDMVRLLENLDGKPIDLPKKAGKATITFSVVEHLPSNVAARTVYQKSELRVLMEFSDDTYKRIRRNDWFARSTVPHELAHVMKHLPELVHLTELPHDKIALARSTSSHPVREDSEYQAERYAAAYVAPDTGLRFLERRGQLTAYDLSLRYIMSPLSAQYRIDDFKRAEIERQGRKGGR